MGKQWVTFILIAAKTPTMLPAMLKHQYKGYGRLSKRNNLCIQASRPPRKGETWRRESEKLKRKKDGDVCLIVGKISGMIRFRLGMFGGLEIVF